MYNISDKLRDDAAIKSCECAYLSEDDDIYSDYDEDEDYPYDTTEEAYD